jgi:4,5-DOPA dioxygenase extradiol
MSLQTLEQATQDYRLSETMPVIFVGHGSPMNALESNAFTRSLQRLGESVQPRPQAILVVSAHWLTEGTFVHAGRKPQTIHDFGAFPPELFAVQYPAPGAPEMAHAVAQLLPNTQETQEWGLDHGAWTILKHLYPEAVIPVFQLSIDYRQPMRYHYELAAYLRSMRERGVLVIGSGNVVHNLRLSIPRLVAEDKTPLPWAEEFDAWVKDRIHAGDFASLIHYEKTGKAGMLAVPTMDHYAPLLYTLALADPSEPITDVYEEVIYGGLSMRTFRVG